MRKLMIGTLLLAATVAHGQAPSPYSGEEQRTIKALSEDQIQAYLAGAGMGLAKAAELNHYPGPKHVLELAAELGLTAEQRRKTNALKIKVLAAARALGGQLIEKERELDAAFAGGEITAKQLDTIVGEVAEIQGKLRAAHLRAHIDQRALLTHLQIQVYDRLRGYETDARHDHGDHSGHDH